MKSAMVLLGVAFLAGLALTPCLAQCTRTLVNGPVNINAPTTVAGGYYITSGGVLNINASVTIDNPCSINNTPVAIYMEGTGTLNITGPVTITVASEVTLIQTGFAPGDAPQITFDGGGGPPWPTISISGALRLNRNTALTVTRCKLVRRKR